MEYTHYSQVFRTQVAKYGDRVAMRFKDNGVWKEISWRQFGEQVQAVAKALIEYGIGEQETVGIFSANRPEWSMADIGSLMIRAVPVPIYATDTARQAEYIINHAEIKVIFAGSQEQYDKLLKILPANKFLQKIVVFDDKADLGGRENAVFFKDFLDMGRKSAGEAEIEERLARVSRNDLLTLSYTSGTTGEPKGAMITHANVISQAAAHDVQLIDPNDQDVSLCFLPLSHIFERTWTYYVYYKGMVNNYLADPAQIIDFIQEVKPTIMCAVPRFYEKIYAAVFDRLESASPTKKKLFNWSVSVGRERNTRVKDELPISPMLALKYKVADTLVLKKLRGLTGGRIKFFPCAGAPLSDVIEEFFYSIGIFVCYGYGLTETTATVTCHLPRKFKFGAVGHPLPGVEVKISPDNDEVLVRGANVMKGYYKRPDATAEVFTEDGFFRTGDAGLIEDNGELRITDRIKDLMKTSGGKYIPPQLIETSVGADYFIEQIAIIGDRRKYVTALIVPSFPALEEYARLHNIKYSNMEELVKNPEIIELYRKRIEDSGQELAGYQKIKKFTLMAKEFSVESGEVTPTMKLKRKVIVENYKNLIDSMYEE